MQLTIDIPDQFAPALQAKWDDLGQAAREALAVAAIQQEVLSQAQARELLGLGWYEMEGVLKRHGVLFDYTPEEIEEELRHAALMVERCKAERDKAEQVAK